MTISMTQSITKAIMVQKASTTNPHQNMAASRRHFFIVHSEKSLLAEASGRSSNFTAIIS